MGDPGFIPSTVLSTEHYLEHHPNTGLALTSNDSGCGPKTKKIKSHRLNYVNASFSQRLDTPFGALKIEAQTGTGLGSIGWFVGETGLEPKAPNSKARPLS